jgi:hypothetical protein
MLQVLCGLTDMLVQDLNKGSDIRFCVDMYLARNDDTFLPADRDIALQNVAMHARLKRFIKCLRGSDGKILAWILCKEIAIIHQRNTTFQQMYFATDLTGVKAYRAISLLHEAMYEFSKKTPAAFCMSGGSHMDPNFVFTRMLEKLGWDRRGYLAVKRIVR